MKESDKLIEGINLSKDEFKKCAEINKELSSCEFKEVEDRFINIVRQKFGITALFENLKPKEKNNSLAVLACRFKKKRPLLFLITNNANNSWVVIDEKRLKGYGDDSFQFEKAIV